MNPKIEDIIRKIKGCLAKADSTRNDNLHEVELAMETAQRLMKEHELSISQVEAGDMDGDQITQTETDLKESWHGTLGLVVDLLCGTKCYKHWNGYEKNCSKSLRFVGLKRDVEIAKVLYNELLYSILHLVKTNEWESKVSFCAGIVNTLYYRAQDQKQTDKQHNQAYALVVQSKADRIRAWMEQNGLYLTKRSSGTRYNGTDYSNGQKAGQNIAMGAKKISSGLALTYK